MSPLSIKLEVFEGPLDLLLHLIEKNKVDIYDIPIAVISDQYMEYLDRMKESGIYDLDTMSDFLVMASTLLSIKAKMLLPKKKNEEEEEEEDPRAELVARLLEYKMFKSFARALRDKEQGAGDIVVRPPSLPEEVLAYQPKIDTSELLAGISLPRLGQIFDELIAAEKRRMDPIRARFGEIRKEEVSLEERMEELVEYADGRGRFSFSSFFRDTESHTRVSLIVTFLAVLELMKSGDFSVVQEEAFGDILMERRAAAQA